MTSESACAASVIIPSSGRPMLLERTLEALCNQRCGVNCFEVIVADDGAEPPLDERLRCYQDRLDLQWIRLSREGPGAARNAAAAIARSSLLVFLDDDCVPAPNWLSAYLDAFAAAPDAALAGPITNALPRNLYSEAYCAIFEFLYVRHISRSDSSPAQTTAPFVISANFAVATDLFRKLGGFDERLRIAAEDRMFSEEWVHRGGAFRSVPSAIVRHDRPLTFSQFLAQQYVAGRGRAILDRAVRDRAWPVKRAEKLSFYLGLLAYPFQGPLRRSRMRLCLLLAISQLAVAVGCVVERMRDPLTAGRT